MIKNQNIELVAGDMPVIVIGISVADGSAFDPSGASATWTLAKTSASTGSDIYATKATASGAASFVQYLDQDSGELQWALHAPLEESDTSTLAAGSYYHEAFVIESNGQRSHLMTGKFTILATPSP